MKNKDYNRLCCICKDDSKLFVNKIAYICINMSTDNDILT